MYIHRIFIRSSLSSYLQTSRYYVIASMWRTYVLILWHKRSLGSQFLVVRINFHSRIFTLFSFENKYIQPRLTECEIEGTCISSTRQPNLIFLNQQWKNPCLEAWLSDRLTRYTLRYPGPDREFSFARGRINSRWILITITTKRFRPTDGTRDLAIFLN